MARNITPRERDYSQWYLDVIKAAEMADYAPVRGCMVIRPTGYAIWESIQSQLDERFKATGHVNAYFPLLIPSSFLEKEAKHVEGFSPECAVVTHAGGEELEEPLVIRPTSETVIGYMYSKWVQSWRDLPILINQWCNVLRWEKRPMEETLRMLEVYRSFMEEVLALPVVVGEKSEGERFPGAENTYTCEAMMTDKRALQAGTSHFLGQNFAKAFDIKFQNRDGELEYAWTTSWGASTRLIGAIVMTHADNDGLVLPPNVAPIKVVVIPISPDQDRLRDIMLPEAQRITEKLKALLGRNRVVLDMQFHMRPGDRFFYHLQRGVPLRLELGEVEMNSSCVRAVRRDTAEVVNISFDAVEREVPKLLDEIQRSLFEKAKAFRESNTYQVSSFDEFKEVLNDKGGFIKAYFAGTPEDERAIKEATTATVRCFLLDDSSEGTCFYTKRPGGRLAIFAKAY